MKSIGNGWKRAREARQNHAQKSLDNLFYEAQARYIQFGARSNLYGGAISGGGSGMGGCFDQHVNMTQSKPIYAASQGFHLDAARAVREGLINPPLPRSRHTPWQRFKNWLA